MDRKMILLLLFSYMLCLLTFSTSSSAQAIPSSSSSAVNQPSPGFDQTQDLRVLNSFIHWTFDSSSNIVDMAFRMTHIEHDRWIAWAINPTSKGMIGAQAFVAFQQSDGTTKAYTTPITSYVTRMHEGNLSFPVFNISATYANNEMVIFTKFKLPTNTTTVNHVWQEGPMRGSILGAHSMTGPNLYSFASIDFSPGKAVATKGGSEVGTNRRNRLKIIHGVLNTVGWGTLMPLGTIFPLLKIFPYTDPTWFYLHISCQLSGYVIGITGGIIGFVIGHGKQSFGVDHEHSAHAYIGVLLLALATLQVGVALRFRPKKDDKNRLYWNIFHWFIGYTTIGLGIYNVFRGLTMVDASGMWRTVYIVFLSMLAAVFVLLQVLRCKINCTRITAREPDGECTMSMEQVV